MPKIYLYCAVLLIIGTVSLATEVGDVVAPEEKHDEINPLEILEEADTKERDERSVFNFFKKPEPAANPHSQSNGWGFKTGGGYGGGGGYGSGGGYGGGGYGGGGYGGGGHYGHNAHFGPGQGVKTVHNQNLEYGYSQPREHNTGYGHGYYGGMPASSFHMNPQGHYVTGFSAAQKTIDFLTNARQQLPIFGRCQSYLLPPNVQYSCRGDQCEVSCPAMNTFPNGKNSLKMVCIGSSWIIRDSEYVTVPMCHATCNPPCQNNGICLEAGMCKCPDNFSGPLCQNKKTVCPARPPMPKNSKISCMNNICNAQCLRGFQFPDGSSITNIECQNGEWIHKPTGLTKPPDCGPTCEPACENGGQCISFNVCSCAKTYRGSHCQHSVTACNVTKTGFNGNYKCSYDNDVAKCNFVCPSVPGLTVQGDLSISYMCNYDDGQFYPLPLPKCIFPPNWSLKSKSHSYTELSHVSSHERIMSIFAKYKDIDQKSEWWSSEETLTLPASYNLYTASADANMVIDKVPKKAFCTTWGGNNVKTFDNLVYRSPLSCSHTLVTDKKDGTFDLILKSCPLGSGYGCSHSLQIYWQNILYNFENQNDTVKLYTPSKNLPIPVQVMGMKVVPVAQHLLIELDSVGLKVEWDRHQYVGIHAGPALWNRAAGLCGSLDGDNQNDLMTRNGDIAQTVKTFTDSWRVQDPSNDVCLVENTLELEYDPKECDASKRAKALSVCERLLGNEKLDECVKTMNFETLLKNCMDDYCNCANREHPETCNCDSVSMLAKECAFRGVVLEHGWRNLEICPISCDFGRIYLPCGPDVEPTCESAVVPTKGKCNEGCFCPEGTVQYKDACITPELCPCTMHGKEFKPEATIKKNCNTCTCKNGQWKCTEDSCGARCSCWGDPHYTTFDGKKFDFMGKCSYYMLKTSNVSVEAENIVSGGPTATKSITVRYVQRNGVAVAIKMDQGLTVSVNNREITKLPKILGDNEIVIRAGSSSILIVEFADGLQVWWDGNMQSYIDAPNSYRNRTMGLCGTFNSNTEDDFLTPEGDIETGVEAFSDKWKTMDSCGDVETPVLPHPCTTHPERKAAAEKHCAWITDDVFQDCHWNVDPENYYDDCIYDMCACEKNPEQCYCPILTAYGDECMRQGIKTGWRMTVKECAIKCPMGQVYDECGDSCTHTCEDLASKNTCERQCIDGCRCPHGEFLNEDNECVPKNKCHCTFDGVTFKPGYKEVRPGSKALDICTCQNGLWECDDAEEGDDKKYPPSSELRAECANRPYAEFTKCAAKEPKTCKNMHEYKLDLEECAPGCQCMEGYVYDVAIKMCVLPEKCSCHHGGKSYNDGERMKEDCNTCICQAGNWKCSSQGCESTCSVWGDSHFTTFDKHDFDFQGTCDYVLSKGVAENGDGYSITIQNVLCGSMGVTCSKSVEIALTGSVQDTLVLSADSSYFDSPDKSMMSKIRSIVNEKPHGAFRVYKAGVFIVIEILPLNLQIKWDEGTRIYVKLGSEWKNKVSGLCGNYNDNAMDDMRTPSLALEASPLIFGHSWKVQSYCSVPTQPIDACKEHPNRETWAQLKCGILKSDTFKECHAEVPVEKYLKRCIFDTCACDQGGDCECLCTAIAAYSHACSQKGVNIRWRTPHLCPMQCDPHCSEYKSCTPACAVETCDNFLDRSIGEHMCLRENCIEGCHIKPCDEGMIYLNDTYKECVPKSECKPMCMIKDGTTYYEGDITYKDECATCRCSMKKEVCSGVKCTEEITTKGSLIEGTTMKPLNTQEQPKCIKGWTRWFDNDDDTSEKVIRLNDEEKLPRYDRMETIYGTCQKKYMKKIECRVVDTHESSEHMDENNFCNLEEGLACVGQCHDYEIRVFCQCEEDEEVVPVITEKPQTGKGCDAALAEYKEFPGDCHKFLHCQPKGNDGEWSYVEKSCGDAMMFNPTINVCDHIVNVQDLKPECGKSEKMTTCPEGQVMSECANQCEHTCHYYGMILKKRGLCQEGEHCQPGCVDAKRPNCAAEGKFWRDENTCVDYDECPCMDKSEKYIQPLMPVISDLEVCQCIDNSFTCVLNLIEEEATIASVAHVGEYEEQDHTESAVVIPSSVTPPKKCSPELLTPMIEGDSPLPDAVFNASSSLGPSYLPSMGRLLDNPKENTGAWSPMINDQMQYLEVNLPELEPLFGVIMAGSTDFDNYVTLFKILYSQDGEAYHYLVDETDKPQMFNGPLDSRAPVQSLFKIPIEAKSVRIYPLKWHNSIAMRVELLGCGTATTVAYESTTPTTIKTTPTTEHPIKCDDEHICYDPMGVENGEMNAKQVRASSIWSKPKMARKPRLIDLLKLSSPVGWRSVANTPNEYVEFDFLEPRNISGFTTKGGPDGWVNGYKVSFSKNRLIWNKVLTPEGRPRIFPGNQDSDTPQTNYFKTPILTQYLKIMPESWDKNINMRMEPLGCFVAYPLMKENIKEVETVPTKCSVCEGVIDFTAKEGECKCKDDLFWDGTECVRSNLCPCVENYINYPIGSKFENKNCEECVCVLGGQSSCKPKKCPPCGENLRSVVAPGCYCKCEPCPKHQKLCPSSGDCIPEILWCNGIRDCADDEDSTCSDKFELESEKKTNSVHTEIITCPAPECPPKMKMKIIDKKQRKMSNMFSSTFTKHLSIVNDGGKITKTKVVMKSSEFLPRPSEDMDYTQEEDCEEFTCVPIQEKVVQKNATLVCVEPKCPPNYNIELDMSSAKPGDCPKYTCILRPTKDDFCEISGKTITTFDGTEFKYDTCSHILARDLMNSSWIISVNLQCTDATRKLCRKMITIKDLEDDAMLTIMPNMMLNFKGYEYTVEQLINSPICKASFVISKPGNTVLVVSTKRGFWVLYDDIGYIKVGISSKFIKTVDGLCGYYDGIAGNDKRAPDGTIIANTAKFGDSWFDKKVSKDECYPQTCPMSMQKKALALCNTIKHPTFMKCGKSVNYKQFVSKCMETTCECLKANNGDANTCKCNILQDFVKKCLTINPNVKMDTWRAIHQCEINCPETLVHNDCYKRRCEPSCDTLNNDDCPVISDACFSGCYCPEGSVRKGETCVPIAECKDCVCNTIGSSKYFTYDRNSFTFNGNCTYLLSRDIVLPGVHTFQVYVTMDDCQKLGKTNAPEHSSCAKSLHILNGDHVIHIQRDLDNPKLLQTLVDGFEVKKMPYKDSWINLRDIPGKELILTLPESHVELKASFDDLVFSIGVPSVKYGNKMEGLCGDCDGNPNNDLQQNPAKKNKRKHSKDMMDIIRSWQADEPKLGLDANECLSEEVPKDECIPLPPEQDPCMKMFDSAAFSKCNMIIDPLPFISTCQQDLCKPGNDQKGACESLSAYAKECATQGICLEWRTPELCPYDCPADQIYKSCGCSKSCDSLVNLSDFQAVNIKTNTFVDTMTSEDLCPFNERFEGCFCPEGKVLEKGKCISEQMCSVCEDGEHMPGDRWQKDKCTECLCDKAGKTQCVERKCMVEENICSEGFKPHKIVNEEECCPKYNCVPEPKLPPAKICLEPLMPQCGPGQFKKQKTGPDGCPQYICECKPKEDCDALVPPSDMKTGEKLIKDDSGCCPTQKVVCDKSTCPPKLESCVEEFYEVNVKQEPTDCCPTYYCAPPKDICIVQHEPNKKFTKKLNDKWLHPKDPCKQEQCAYGPNDTTQINTILEKCETKCDKGFGYVNKQPEAKCCGECVQTQCVFENKLYDPEQEWKSEDECTLFKCVTKEDVMMVSSQVEVCPDVSECPEHLLYNKEDSCCKLCKEIPPAEDMKNCLPVSLAESETKTLVKISKPGHGFCVNMQPIQGFTECMGSCDSGSKYNKATLLQDKICNCCNIKSYKTISVELTCEDGTKFTKDLEIPAACGCQPCSDSSEYKTSDAIDVRLHPLPLGEFIHKRK